MKSIVIACALLAGCATSLSEDSDQNLALVSRGTGANQIDTQRVAAAHCAKFGKQAVFAGDVSNWRITYAYRCE